MATVTVHLVFAYILNGFDPQVIVKLVLVLCV